jgi:hypothetical protein
MDTVAATDLDEAIIQEYAPGRGTSAKAECYSYLTVALFPVPPVFMEKPHADMPLV